MKKYLQHIGLKVLIALFSTVAFSYSLTPKKLTERIIFSENDTQHCLKCHGMANFAFRDSATLAIHDYSVNADSFKLSVHGKLHCQQCHADIKEYPHTFSLQDETRTKVSCGYDCHAVDGKGNLYTHRAEQNDFQESVHKKGLTDPNSDNPTCVTCHGNLNPHHVAKVSKAISPKEKMTLCISCHDNKEMMVKHKVNPEAVTSYKRSFHYKMIRFGETSTAVCQDCHTAHHIVPKDSSKSSIAIGNIANTCGQEKCHRGAKMNFAMSGANHLDLRIEREPLLKFEEQFFILLTSGTMAMLVVGIILDVQKKFGWFELFVRFMKWAGGKLSSLIQARRKVYFFLRKILVD